MKHLNFILAGLFFLCGLCCRAQVLPLEENVVLNTKEGQIKGKLLLPGGVKTCPVVLIIAGSGPTDMDGNSAIGNLRNNSLKFLAEGLAANGIASLRFDKRGIGTSASAGKEEAKLRFEDYVNDVTGWIDYLAKEKRFKVSSAIRKIPVKGACITPDINPAIPNKAKFFSGIYGPR